MIKALLILLLFPIQANASEWFTPFDKEDYAYQAVYTIAACIDWRQTQTFTKTGREEQNIILGKNPSRKRIDTLIPLAIAANWATSYILPKDMRKLWQVFFVAVEGSAIMHNHKIGVRMSF